MDQLSLITILLIHSWCKLQNLNVETIISFFFTLPSCIPLLSLNYALCFPGTPPPHFTFPFRSLRIGYRCCENKKSTEAGFKELGNKYLNNCNLSIDNC